MSVNCVPTETPLLYSKTGEYRGIPIFLFWFQNIDSDCVPTIYVLRKKKCTENFHFLQVQKSLFIACSCFRNSYDQSSNHVIQSVSLILVFAAVAKAT